MTLRDAARHPMYVGTTRRPLHSILAAVGLFAAVALPASIVSAAPVRTFELFVAPDGRGAGCTEPVPCTLESARERVRRLGLPSDIVVWLAGGTYRVEAPFELGVADSGRDGQTITWQAAPGEMPVFSGGVVLSAWHPAPDGVWSAPVPDGLAPRQLYVDGRRAIRARGEGCDRVSECSWTTDGLAGPAAERYGSFAKPKDLELSFRVRWRNYRCGVESVDGDQIRMEQPCWVNSSTAKHRMPYNWGSTTLDGTRYSGPVFAENARELLDEPGEFYVDTDADTAYYIPRDGEDLTRDEVVAPTTQTLLRLTGVSDLAVRGITFAHTAWDQPSTGDGYSGAQAGFTITGAEGPPDLPGELFTRQRAAVEIAAGERVTVADSTFAHLGGAGIDVRRGSERVTVTRSTFHDISGGAVYVGDTDATPESHELISRNNVVSFNHISSIGLEFTDSVAIWGGYERELVVEHNTVEEVPYSGISLGWGWTAVQENPMRDNRISGNRIVEAMSIGVGMHDGGGIYTQGIQPGTVISGNYINRVEHPTFDAALDGNGIYCDERSSHIDVTGNVITRIGGKWISNWAGYGEDIHAYGNWADVVSPPLSGRGSVKENNAEGLTELPAEAIAVARSAGARTPSVVEQLLTVAPGLPSGEETTVRVGVPNTTAEEYTDVTVRLTAPAGWQVDDPVRTVASIPSGESTIMDFSLVAPDDAGSARVTAEATYTVADVGPGIASGIGTVETGTVLPSFQAAFTMVAITDDAAPEPGTFSNSGRSYSAQALAEAGIVPGGKLTHGGVEVGWPDVPAGEPNGVFADGQTFELAGQGETLAFFGAAAYGAQAGTGTIYYTDGSSQPFTISFPDWFDETGADAVARMPYSNSQDGRFEEDASVFYEPVSLDPAKTLRAVRLPDSGMPFGPGIRILALGVG